MKHVKKLTSLLLALVMVLAMSVTAFAAGETGTITIDNAVIGQTYTIYKILDLESYDKTAGAYSYKAADDWSDFINRNDIKGKYVNVDDQGYVTWVEDASAADFAKDAQAYAKTNSIAPAVDSVTATTTTVKFENLKLGYYLLDSSLGTLCALDTTNPDVTIKEKNAEPTNEKTVEEDSTGNYGGVNDADIGQTVKFKSTITLPKGSENVTFHDTMSPGLTLNAGSIKVYTDAALTTELAAGNYTVTATGLTDNCTFEVSFTQTYLDGLTSDTTVYVGYSATVNSNAVVGGNGNPNTSKVEYGEEGKTTYTPDSTTITYTWDVDVFKYTMNDGKEKPLAGAKFTLSKNQNGTDPIALVDEDNNVYRVATSDDTTTITEITTDASGKFTIEGLDSDTYYLTEIAAPAGYNKLAGPITVVIGEKGVVNATTDAPNGVSEVKVLNQSGTELPSTGGMGTTIFYVLGFLLVAGSAVLLITKKRMSVEK